MFSEESDTKDQNKWDALRESFGVEESKFLDLAPSGSQVWIELYEFVDGPEYTQQWEG